MATIDKNYTYSLGRVKELEKGLLSDVHLDRLMESDDPLTVLRGLGFFTSAEEHEEHDTLAEIFRRERVQNRVLLHELIADSPLEDVFLLPYDFHNIKLLLKGKLSGNQAIKEWPLETGKYSRHTLVDAIYDDLPSDLPAVLVDDIHEIGEAFQNTRNFALVDHRLDRRLRAMQLEIARTAKSVFLVSYLQHLADIYNITTLIRRKTHELGRDELSDALLDTGTLAISFFEKVYDTGWESIATAFKPTDYSPVVAAALAQIDQNNFLAILDTACQRFLIEFLRQAKQQCFGVEPIVAFYLAREHELKVARTIWIGKLFEYPLDRLRIRMKELF
jgi:V/A-type H+-transporting ATPase subunit C